MTSSRTYSGTDIILLAILMPDNPHSYNRTEDGGWEGKKSNLSLRRVGQVHLSTPVQFKGTCRTWIQWGCCHTDISLGESPHYKRWICDMGVSNGGLHPQHLSPVPVHAVCELTDCGGYHTLHVINLCKNNKSKHVQRHQYSGTCFWYLDLCWTSWWITDHTELMK